MKRRTKGCAERTLRIFVQDTALNIELLNLELPFQRFIPLERHHSLLTPELLEKSFLLKLGHDARVDEILRWRGFRLGIGSR